MKKIAVILLSLAILLVVCAVVFLNLKKNDTKKTQTKNKISYYECVKEESINKYLTSRNIQKIYYDKDKNITKIDETKEYNVVDDIEYEAIKDYFSNCKDSYKENKKIICNYDNDYIVNNKTTVKSYINSIDNGFKCELRNK